MAIYEEKFKNHPIHENLLSIIKRIESFASEQTEPEAIEHLTRLLEIANLVTAAFNNVGHIFIPESTLNQLNKILNNINNDFNTFENNKDINQLVTANSRADNLLINLQQIPKIETIPDLQNFSELHSKYHDTINSIIKSVSKKKDQLENQINDLTTRLDQFDPLLKQHDQTIESQKGRLDTAISQFQNQFSEAEDRRRENLETQINKFNEESQNFRQNMNSELNSFLEQRRQEVNQAISKYNEEANKNIEELKKNADALYRAHENEAEGTLTFLGEKREEAKRLLDIIGNIGFTGNYNKIANQERSTANILRIAAIIFMIAGIFVIGTVVFNISKTGFDWKLVLSRIGVTVTILIPAFYAARESDRHRQREVRNRKMELELASIGPYLELLPDDKKIELKSKLTEKLFGQPVEVTEKGDFVSASSLFSLVEKILTNLTKK